MYPIGIGIINPFPRIQWLGCHSVCTGHPSNDGQCSQDWYFNSTVLDVRVASRYNLVIRFRITMERPIGHVVIFLWMPILLDTGRRTDNGQVVDEQCITLDWNFNHTVLDIWVASCLVIRLQITVERPIGPVIIFLWMPILLDTGLHSIGIGIINPFPPIQWLGFHSDRMGLPTDNGQVHFYQNSDGWNGTRTLSEPMSSPDIVMIGDSTPAPEGMITGRDTRSSSLEEGSRQADFASTSGSPFWKALVKRRRNSLCLIWILAFMGGLLIGCEPAVSGNILQLEDILHKFFRHIFHERRFQGNHLYCKPPSWKLQGLSFSWSFLPIITSIFAIPLSIRCSWRIILWMTIIWIFVGAVLGMTSSHVSLFIIGRVMASTGVGFAYTVVPKYIAEICSTKWRREISIFFSVSVVIGSLLGNVVNFYASQKRPWGWRLLLGIEAVPCLILFPVSLFLVEAPRSYIERKQVDLAEEVLVDLRGASKGQEEFLKLKSILSDTEHESLYELWIKYKAYVLISVASQICSTLNGSMAVYIMMPQIFGFLGYDPKSAIISSAITTCVTIASYELSILLVPRMGRRRIVLSSLFVACLSLLCISFMMLLDMGDEVKMRTGPSRITICIMCVYNMCCAVCSNPTGWMSEDFPLQMTWVGSMVSTTTNWLFTFLIAQALTLVPCYLHSWTFLLFAFFCGLFFGGACVLLPETANLKSERALRSHHIWRRFHSPRAVV